MAALRANAADRHTARTTTSRAGTLVVAILLAICVTPLAAGRSLPVPLATRARGAERIVLARVASVIPAWRQNEFGDRLIVSLARLAVDETLKGRAEVELVVEVEGGTIGGLTLRVSDLEPITPGDRGIFYLHRNRAGMLVPHLRGQGILKLDHSDRVPGSSLTLDEIRRTVAQAEAAR